MRIALAQKNLKIGDFNAIDALVLECFEQAKAQKADLLVFSELFLIGGPAGELATRREVLQGCATRLDAIAQACNGGPAILIGYPEFHRADLGKGAYNAAAYIQGGRVQNIYRQVSVPDFGVKNDRRLFDPSPHQQPFACRGQAIGVAIGNDVWNESTLWGDRVTHRSPAQKMLAQSDVLIHLDADPWYAERPEERLQKLRQLAQETQRWICHVNAIGGQEQLIYDGRSMVIAPDGSLHQIAPRFEDAILYVDLPKPGDTPTRSDLSQPAVCGDPVDETLDALILGLRDGVRKSGFRDVTLGLSGGIDSALVAAIAYEALGPDHVHTVALPSRYSSDHSIRDARELAEALKLPFSIIEIEGVYQAFAHALADAFSGTEPDTSEENLQARARGTILMGLSNKFNRLVLATSNKSEFAVGYCTLYGDMCGAFAVLTDVPKRMVYKLSRRFNERMGFEAIPESTLTKPPSAELRPGQTDQDSLPAYEILDEIVDRYLVHDQSAAEIVAAGFEEPDVRRVVWLLNLNGYKRAQAAPGLLVSRRALAIGRQFPNIASYQSLNLK